MEYVSTFIHFCQENWKAISAAAVVVAGLAYGLAKKWKQIKSQ